MAQLTLKSLNVARLQSHELAQLVARTLSELAAEGLDRTEDVVMGRLLSQLQTALPNYEASLDQVRGSQHTASIASLDNDRDLDLQSLFDSIKPFKNSRLADEKAAYESLSRLFAQFKDAKASNYEEETNKIKQLLSQLKSDSYAASSAELGLKKRIDLLTESQAAFEVAFASRSEEKRNKVSYDGKALRQALSQPYQLLADYLKIVVQVMPEDEKAVRTLKTLNNSRQHFADLLARR